MNAVKFYGIVNVFAGSQPGDTHEVYPAVYKASLRRHIQEVCSRSFCAESFVIYVTGPSRMDGSTLLWDVNHDGVVSIHDINSALSRCCYDVNGVLSDVGQ